MKKTSIYTGVIPRIYTGVWWGCQISGLFFQEHVHLFSANGLKKSDRTLTWITPCKRSAARGKERTLPSRTTEVVQQKWLRMNG